MIFRVGMGTSSKVEITKRAARGSSTIVWPVALLIVLKKLLSRTPMVEGRMKTCGQSLHLLLFCQDRLWPVIGISETNSLQNFYVVKRLCLAQIKDE